MDFFVIETIGSDDLWMIVFLYFLREERRLKNEYCKENMKGRLPYYHSAIKSKSLHYSLRIY